MIFSPAGLKRWGLLCWLILFGLWGYADTLTLTPNFITHNVKLNNWLLVREDTGQTITPAVALSHPEWFAPMGRLRPQQPTNIFWLRATLRNVQLNDPEFVLLFSNLTFVDAWLYAGDSCVWRRRAGAFRPQQQIEPGDGRFHIRLPLAYNRTCTLLLRVHHTKHYQPVFDFSLQQRDAFTQQLHQSELIDGWMHGAVSIFFIYAFLSWLVSRFRPYLWLMFFIAGVGLYGFCTNGYFIDWFFPNDPATGWIFNLPFLNLGMAGIYMLILDFWELRRNHPRLYRFGIIAIIVLVATSATGICIDSISGNFNLVNNIHLWEFNFPAGFIISSLWICRNRLSRSQYYLYYGIILLGLAGLFITLSSVLFHEKSLWVAPYVTNPVILIVFLLFTIGLKEALRQHEIEKNAALNTLNELQKQQNILLETKVKARTGDLLRSNEELAGQKRLLSQRNAQIETLMNELSHRVKNNLQLLYSLLSLQVPHLRDETSREILRGNIARIQAMMLVNNKLQPFEDGQPILLNDFMAGLTAHLQEVYDADKRVRIEQSIPPDIGLQAKNTLSAGLILLELLTNSYKYAFHNHKDPVISIRAARTPNNEISLLYGDNGVGMQKPAKNNGNSMGLSLIKDLVRQINGTMDVQYDNGIAYQFTFPAVFSK